MPGRALSFGMIAEAYERYRPGYPEELFELVADYAGRPIRTALEIGAGTGKATRLFAAHGVAVTATDPDPAMLAELRKHADVRTEQAAFEELAPGERYDLVFAAAALHWTRPEGRWTRIKNLLEPGGVYAGFGGPIDLADPAVAAAVQEARAPHVERDDMPSPDGTPPGQAMQWPGTELLRSPWFTDVRQVTIPRRLTMSRHDYLGHLGTISAYLQLSPDVREMVFERIAAVLPETVDIDAHITGHVARRTPDPE